MLMNHYFHFSRSQGGSWLTNTMLTMRRVLASMGVQHPVLAQASAGLSETLTPWLSHATIVSPHLTLGLREHREAFLMEGSVAWNNSCLLTERTLSTVWCTFCAQKSSFIAATNFLVSTWRRCLQRCAIQKIQTYDIMRQEYSCHQQQANCTWRLRKCANGAPSGYRTWPTKMLTLWKLVS